MLLIRESERQGVHTYLRQIISLSRDSLGRGIKREYVGVNRCAISVRQDVVELVGTGCNFRAYHINIKDCLDISWVSCQVLVRCRPI